MRTGSLGDRATVRVDVNQTWRELDAVRGIAQLERCGIDLVEQPVRAENRGAMRRLAARFDVAMMVDEALHGPGDAFDIARSDSADVLP